VKKAWESVLNNLWKVTRDSSLGCGERSCAEGLPEIVGAAKAGVLLISHDERAHLAGYARLQSHGNSTGLKSFALFPRNSAAHPTVTGQVRAVNDQRRESPAPGRLLELVGPSAVIKGGRSRKRVAR